MSDLRLRISTFVIERLANIQDLSTGQLFGISCDDGPVILGFAIRSKIIPGAEEEIVSNKVHDYNVLPHLPGNVVNLGAFVATSPDAGDIISEKDISKCDNSIQTVLLHIDIKSHSIISKVRKGSKFLDIAYEIVKEPFLKTFLHFHLTGKIVLSCNFDYNSAEEAFSTLRKKLEQGLAFQMKDTEVFILENGTEALGIGNNADVSELISVTNSDSSHKSKNGDELQIFQWDMFLKNSSDSSNPEIAPVIKYVKKSFKCAKINMIIDTLAMVSKKTKVNQLYDILCECVRRSVTLNEESLLKQFKSSDSSKISLPQIFHFYPKKCGHFFTVAYPKKLMEDQLATVRENFHQILSLPLDMPVFRRGNVYSFEKSSRNSGNLLINPHEGLRPSGVVDGELSIVQGQYAYHHYMQDGFDDNGWGCAYRSLQTIFSWFRHQGFTNKPIPTHKEIQQCLVDIGDQQRSFVGSKSWIGSNEVSYVLDTMLSVPSRILSVSSGEEMSTKGGELSHHFKTQGTPVMIGGGVLAHTILGVDYNRKTGDLKFLILDPHYTGEEDLSVVQSKGWCGWKGLDFWKKNAYYNMCLPMKPKSV